VLAVFGAAVKVKDPVPNPPEFDVIESQLVVVLTVHGQFIWVLTAMLLVSPGAGEAIFGPGENV
jgi:hypothetical protein